MFSEFINIANINYCRFIFQIQFPGNLTLIKRMGYISDID